MRVDQLGVLIEGALSQVADPIQREVSQMSEHQGEVSTIATKKGRGYDVCTVVSGPQGGFQAARPSVATTQRFNVVIGYRTTGEDEHGFDSSAQHEQETNLIYVIVGCGCTVPGLVIVYCCRDGDNLSSFALLPIIRRSLILL